MNAFNLYRNVDNRTITSSRLEDIFSITPSETHAVEKEQAPWLFIVPHDDDAMIGGGLLLQCLQEKNIPISVVITTDGSLGYCDARQKETIAEIRRRESLDSFQLINIKEVEWLNFPDCNLSHHGGRRVAKLGDPYIVEGYTGLQNAFTYCLRKIRPSRVFVATGADINIDHQAVYHELLISIFHASGGIWPELGKTLPWVPKVYEMAIYCDFPELPDIKIAGNPDHLEKKIEAIKAFRSQEQIDLLVQNVRSGGAVEYFRDINFRFYSPRTYENLFQLPETEQ